MITKADADKYTFAEYRKVGTTKLSNEVLPAGAVVGTLEGYYTCAEPSRLGIDVSGNVYPVAESVRLKSYELADVPGNYTEAQKAMAAKSGTPDEFAVGVNRAADDLYCTSAEADAAISKYRREWVEARAA